VAFAEVLKAGLVMCGGTTREQVVEMLCTELGITPGQAVAVVAYAFARDLISEDAEGTTLRASQRNR
jgi:hypothetical protein